MLGKAWVCAFYMQKERKFNFYFIVRFWVVNRGPPLHKARRKGASQMEAQIVQRKKRGKFNSPLIVRFRVVGDANPYKVGACLKQKEGKFNLPLNVYFCNGRRNASPTGISDDFSRFCRDRRLRLSFMNVCFCSFKCCKATLH